MRLIRKWAILSRRLPARIGWIVGLLLCIICTTPARADMVVLRDTTLVSGSASAVFSFNVPAPGTVSVQLTDLHWPQALNTLSLVAATASQVLASWSGTSLSSSQTLYFQVAGPGSYFADVTATAGGPLGLGVYSLSLDFKPASSPVPLPSSGWLLVAGMLMVAVLLPCPVQISKRNRHV